MQAFPADTISTKNNYTKSAEHTVHHFDRTLCIVDALDSRWNPWSSGPTFSTFDPLPLLLRKRYLHKPALLQMFLCRSAVSHIHIMAGVVFGDNRDLHMILLCHLFRVSVHHRSSAPEGLLSFHRPPPHPPGNSYSSFVTRFRSVTSFWSSQKGFRTKHIYTQIWFSVWAVRLWESYLRIMIQWFIFIRFYKCFPFRGSVASSSRMIVAS